MNRIATPMTPTAAEGLPRRCFTVAALEQMAAAGILRERQTRVHREPTPTGYRSVVDVSSSQRLVPTLAPSLAVVLSELDVR
jgi:hypothetical protein